VRRAVEASLIQHSGGTVGLLLIAVSGFLLYRRRLRRRAAELDHWTAAGDSTLPAHSTFHRAPFSDTLFLEPDGGSASK